MKKSYIISCLLFIALSGVNNASAQSEPDQSNPDKVVIGDKELLELYKMSSVAARLPAYRLYMDLYADKLSIPNLSPSEFEVLLEKLHERARRKRRLGQ